MKIKGIKDEDFVNYKEPCMYICTASCSFKCDKEANGSYCQNSSLAKERTFWMPEDDIIRRYLKNQITKAICFSGMEPFDQTEEIHNFIVKLRHHFKCTDPVIIYTGYNKDEVEDEVACIREWGNIIVKYGRYIPNQEPHFDPVLGVNLASDNQYAEYI